MNSTDESDAVTTCPQRQLFVPEDEALGCVLAAGHWGPHIDNGTSWTGYDLTGSDFARADDIEGGGE